MPDMKHSAEPTDLPKIISVDDHVIEPPHLFDRWLPSKYKEAGPHSIRAGLAGVEFRDGAYRYLSDDDSPHADWWVFEGLKVPLRRNIAAVGFSRDEMTLEGITYDEMRAGCYDPSERLKDMDLNWVEASLSFPTFPRFCGQTFLEAKDKDLALACVRAYNDWMVEEWCGDSAGRLIPLIIIPLWDPTLAAEEVRRNAGRGVHAVCFSEMPSKLGLPSIHTGAWDPVFAACNDLDVTINMHIGSSSSMASASPDAPVAAHVTLAAVNTMCSLSDWLFSGKLAQFPRLKIAYSEGYIGWIPYILERADDVWRDHRAWTDSHLSIAEPPSTYYRDHVFGCFVRDMHGLKSLDEIGVDNVTFETDYPHVDTTWPLTKDLVAEYAVILSTAELEKVIRGNAIRMLCLGN